MSVLVGLNMCDWTSCSSEKLTAKFFGDFCNETPRRVTAKLSDAVTVPLMDFVVVGDMRISWESLSHKVLVWFEQSEAYRKLGKLEWREAVFNKLVQTSPSKAVKEKVNVEFISIVVDHAGPGLPGMDGT